MSVTDDIVHGVNSEALPDAETQGTAPESAARGNQDDQRQSLSSAKMGGNTHLIRRALRTTATITVVALAAVSVSIIWSYYVTAPWTRDGRVRVQVASIAPEVSGQVTQLNVVDNQFVHKGDVLYQINPFDFQVAVDQAKQRLAMKAADAQVKKVQAERRKKLDDLATTPEEQQQYLGNATQALADFEEVQLELAQAEINLQRTKVRSPVNGYVTNLLMRVGDYAHVGTANVSIIDSDSYWIDGYFEETKLAHICVGDRVEAQLVGYAQPIMGRVDTVTRGIGVSDAATGPQGLPNVDPIYTWVRLAQRVPVRIAITDVPSGVPLISGLTVTLTIRGPAGGGGLSDRWRDLASRIGDVVHGPRPRSSTCVEPLIRTEGAVSTLTPPILPPRKSTTDLVPELATSASGPKD